MRELCFLLELLGYCALGLLPALISFWASSSPVVVGGSFILSYHLIDSFTPQQLFWIYAIAISVWWTCNAYCEYAATIKELRLGQPANFRGWCAVMALTTFARVDVLKPPRVRTHEYSYRGHISSLPKRKGGRPTVNTVIPARQLDRKASPDMCCKVDRLVKSYQTRHPKQLQIKMSSLEPDQLDALCWDIEPRSARTTHHRMQDEDWGGEIAHVHGPDGSIHVVLHPEDVGTIIRGGWGERHPLCANDKRWFRFLFHGILEQRLPVPEGLAMIYAPRNAHELQVLDIILKAAIWYATKGELY
ncbi:hypothetical protein C8A00DRAFT_17047, partial [Chaetomidium leptoderma]